MSHEVVSSRQWNDSPPPPQLLHKFGTTSQIHMEREGNGQCEGSKLADHVPGYPLLLEVIQDTATGSQIKQAPPRQGRQFFWGMSIVCIRHELLFLRMGSCFLTTLHICNME